VRKRVAIYGAIIALLLMAWAVADYYSTEIFAVFWHVRHGSHAEVNGIRLPVPLAYEVLESPGLPQLGMIRFAGHAWRGGGMIDINFHKQPSPEVLRLLQSRGLMKSQVLGEQKATLAGTPGKCVEGIPETGNAQLQKLIRDRDFLEIDCWFAGEVEITFRGMANLKNEFYSVIWGAVPVEVKR
jgi:hypothetical protein